MRGCVWVWINYIHTFKRVAVLGAKGILIKPRLEFVQNLRSLGETHTYFVDSQANSIPCLYFLELRDAQNSGRKMVLRGYLRPTPWFCGGSRSR